MEEEVPIAGRDDANDAFKQFQAVYGAPAYVRRARRVEAAFEELLERCLRQRSEWIGMVRLRVGMLLALAGGWDALTPFVSDEDLDSLRRLHDELSPRLRVPVEPTRSARRLRGALRELCESMETFNRRWTTFLAGCDLTEINDLRDGYNRYYVFEKECAVRSPRLARMGFVPLAPLTTEELFALLPPLRFPAPV